MQGVGLHQQPIELHAIEQIPQGLDLAGAVGSIGVLGNGHAEAIGIQAHRTWAMKRSAPVAFSAIEPRRVLPSHTRVSTTSGTPGCAAIHCCNRDSKPSTSSWLSSQRKVESEGDLAM
jgi:hypothetical protein